MKTTIYYGPSPVGGMEPPADLDARCPVCHSLCDTLLHDQAGDIVGCDVCTNDIDIVDYAVSRGEDCETARCPICDALCDTITTNDKGEALGCDCCMSERDAYDYAVEEHNSYMEWLHETAMGGDRDD